MSTVKRHTSEEIEAFIATLPHVATPSCDDLCATINDDIDTLQNLQDFPGNLRARVAAARRSLIAANQQRRAQHCPPCQ